MTLTTHTATPALGSQHIDLQSHPSAREVASYVDPDTPPLARAAYKEQEKQKSLENAAKRAVKGGNTGADEEGGEAEAEEDVEAGGADEAEPQSKRQRTDDEEEEAEAE